MKRRAPPRPLMGLDCFGWDLGVLRPLKSPKGRELEPWLGLDWFWVGGLRAATPLNWSRSSGGFL